MTDRHLTCGAVLDTHIHNDYVTGGYVLAQRTGAQYVVAAQDDVEFDRTPVGDGDELTIGTLRVRVISTPGHTDTHLAFLVDQPGSGPRIEPPPAGDPETSLLTTAIRRPHPGRRSLRPPGSH